MPVVGRQLPTLQRVVATALEPFELLVLRDVHPELDHDNAFEAERTLELRDLVVGPVPLLVRREPVDALDEHPSVPRAIEHCHPAPAGQLVPEARQEVMAPLVGRRRGELRDPDVPWIEATDETLDGATLARTRPIPRTARAPADPARRHRRAHRARAAGATNDAAPCSSCAVSSSCERRWVRSSASSRDTAVPGHGGPVYTEAGGPAPRRRPRDVDRGLERIATLFVSEPPVDRRRSRPRPDRRASSRPGRSRSRDPTRG